MKSTSITTPLVDLGDILAESPLYDARINAVYWVDALGSKIHRVILLDDSHQREEYTPTDATQVMHSHQEISCGGEIVGAIGLTDAPSVLVVNWTRGLGFANFTTRRFQSQVEFNHTPNVHLNDGTIDPDGNFWVGGVDEAYAPGLTGRAKLYRINTDLSIDTMLEGVRLSNGIGFYKNWLFYTDTLTHTVWRFDYDRPSGTISNRQSHISILDHLPTEPVRCLDGFALTEKGHLYTAVWGTHMVLHFDEAGALVEQFVLPAARVSSCAFVGPELNELFITTASPLLPALDDGVVILNPKSDRGGACFRIRLPGVRGLPQTTKWGGSLPPTIL